MTKFEKMIYATATPLRLLFPKISLRCDFREPLKKIAHMAMAAEIFSMLSQLEAARTENPCGRLLVWHTPAVGRGSRTEGVSLTGFEPCCKVICDGI